MSLKGQLISIAAKQFLSSYLKDYAQMLNFSVEPATRTISLELLPKGEPSPIKVTLTGYEITQSGNKATIQFAQTAASREWIDTLLAEYLRGKPFELPAKAAPLLKLLL